MTQAIQHSITALCAVVLLTSCADYEFKFNENTVYTPEPLFSDYALQDPQLKGCVQQTIQDQRVTKAEDLQVLVCTSAGINSVAGLEVFGGLKQLNLAHNLVDNLKPLTKLPELTRLDISDNAIKNVAPLMELAYLEWLNAAENEALNCSSATALKESSDVEITLPEHCRQSKSTP